MIAILRISLYICRCNLDIRIRRGYALEVFQALFNIAQIEYIARAGGNRIPLRGALTGVWRKADGMDTAWNQGECQHAAIKVLWRGQYAGGNKATGNNGILQTLHDDVDALATQATAYGWVILLIGKW